MFQALKNWRKKSKLASNKRNSFPLSKSLALELLEARIQPGSLISPLIDTLGISLLSALMQQMHGDSLNINSQGETEANSGNLQQNLDTVDQNSGDTVVDGLGVIVITTAETDSQPDQLGMGELEILSFESNQTVFGINPLEVGGNQSFTFEFNIGNDLNNDSTSGTGSSQGDNSASGIDVGDSNSPGFGSGESSIGDNSGLLGGGGGSGGSANDSVGPAGDNPGDLAQGNGNGNVNSGDGFNGGDSTLNNGGNNESSNNSLGNEDGLDLNSNSGNGNNQNGNLDLDLNISGGPDSSGSNGNGQLLIIDGGLNLNLPDITLPDNMGPGSLPNNLNEIGIIDQIVVPDLDQPIPNFGNVEGLGLNQPGDPANPVNPNQGQQQGNQGGGGQVLGQGNNNPLNIQLNDPGLGVLGGFLQGPGLGGIGGFGGGGLFDWNGFGNGPLDNNGAGGPNNLQGFGNQGSGQSNGGGSGLFGGGGNGSGTGDSGTGDLSGPGNDQGNQGGGQDNNQQQGSLGVGGGVGVGGQNNGTIPGTGILLTAPEFVRRNESDIVVVSIGDAVAIPASGKGLLDRDINLDGDFLDSGESGFKSFEITGQGTEIDFGNDAKEGNYRLRARVGSTSSNVANMVIDWHSGYIGDQNLLEIVSDPGNSANRRGENEGKVMVQARCTLTKYLGDFTKSLEAMDMKNIHVTKSQNMVTGTIDVSRIMELEQIPHFLAAIKAPLAKPKIGSVTSEGVAVIKADTFVSTTGFDGTGITVGVISDSASPASITASQATGDLPASVNNLSPSVTGSDEGTAMMEIVADVAPGAGLAFLAGTSPQVMASGLSQLVSAGCKVLVDDLGFANTPVFNDGILSQAIDAVAAQGVYYATALGNDGDIAYRAAFSPGTTTIDSVTGTFQDFGGGDFLQDFTLASGDSLQIIFQWSSAFLEGGSALPNYQVTNDFSVLIVDTGAATPTILQTFATDSLNTDQALEVISFTATTSTQLAFAFQLITGANPQEITWMNFGSAVDPQAQGQGAPTAFGQVTAVGAVCVGAVPWNNPNVPEPFTGLGGDLNFYYDDQGNPLPTPEVRRKPDIAGPDNVQTSLTNFNPFPGTSAAAPHVAGVAALLFSQNPTAALQDVIDHMFTTTVPVGIVNDPFLTGNGLVQAIPMTGGSGGSQGVGGENNHTADSATRFGLFSGSQTIGNQRIEFSPEGYPLSDWFNWSAGIDGVLGVLVQVIGEPLEVNVYLRDGNGLVPVGNASGSGSLFLGISVLAGQEIFVEVKGFNFALGQVTTGNYSLTVTL